MARDEHLPISLKFQRLTVILTNQVTQPRLCEPDARSQFRTKDPFELLRGRIEVLEIDVLAWRGRRNAVNFWCVLRWLIRPGVGREGSVEEGRGSWVDGSCEEHEIVREDVGCKAEDSVSIDTCVLKVDTCRAIRTDDDLKLLCG